MEEREKMRVNGTNLQENINEPRLISGIEHTQCPSEDNKKSRGLLV